MQKEKINTKNAGITLVALVLTIVVMLILVGVTISVSLNGGLFSKSKEASSQMQIAAEKEELLEAVIIALGRNGKVNFDNLDNNLPDNFTKIADKTYKSSTGNTYIVTEDGEVNLLGESEEETEEPVTPATITLSTTEISKEITAGTPETVELTATLNNASGDLVWESSDEDVAEISESGTTRTITLKKAGTAIITVSYGDISATCSITVTEIEVATIIEFTIRGTTLYAEEGMTWSEWCDSSYNVPDKNGVAFTVINGVLSTDDSFIPIADESNNKLLPEDKIINGANYVQWAYID